MTAPSTSAPSTSAPSTSDPGTSPRQDPDRVRVLVVDDQLLWRQVVQAHLQREPDLDVVGEAADGSVVRDLAETWGQPGTPAPDVVLLDLDLGEGVRAGGLALLDQLRVLAPTVSTLVLSGSTSTADAVAAFGAGARGFLAKDHPPEDLADAVRAVAQGRPVLPPSAVGAVLEQFRLEAERRERAAVATPGTPRPSVREREVLALLAQGHSNSHISAVLQISTNTVKNHVRALLTKFGVTSRVAVVCAALSCGLLAERDLLV